MCFFEDYQHKYYSSINHIQIIGTFTKYKIIFHSPFLITRMLLLDRWNTEIAMNFKIIRQILLTFIYVYNLPLIMWSSPQRDWATSGSKNVTKLNALNGFGMKTSVTSPNFPKYSFRSSAVMSSVHLPINTLHGTCWMSPSYK